MSYFKEFCESIHKTKAGYVPDLLDLVDQGFGDLCMAAYLSDWFGSDVFGELYLSSDESFKNDEYACRESSVQDAIDAYNQKIDDEREKAKNLELIDDHAWIGMLDPDYKYDRFNQAEIDAGFSGTGREFC